MRLATTRAGGRDGTLVVVADDGQRVLAVEDWPTLQTALEDWPAAHPALLAAADRLARGDGAAVTAKDFAAPLPRAWQWLDGSAFAHHGVLMQRAFGSPPSDPARPLMYQGLSHQFLGPCEDVPLPSEDDGIDFEGEFGVIVDDVPMGCSVADALAHVKLVVLINDWSLRTLAPIEMKTGFGWVQAKPACSVAPFAVTPDSLGDAWSDARVHLDLRVEVNGAWFGNPNGREMAFGFDELIAHAARTRSLPAGTIIGSGTVSNSNADVVGSACLSERRAIEMVAIGSPRTPFLSFGDEVSLNVTGRQGRTIFGELRQRIVRAS
ncbi:fumarylacetoacetate hydrolase family protein [Sphingomonas sp.]|uniref:fumarylacetoacetate hydrolase family protein n=1 Tax=Sphingomonas sp. TaxID=28214 RepID=UPI0031D99FB7